MDERRCVEQLKPHGSMQRDISYSPHRLGHEQYQHGAHTLASALAYMVERLTEQTVGMRQRTVEKLDEVGQLRRDGLSDC